jgi:hypothetical protein
MMCLAGSAAGQISVQLPTYSSFSVSTTVSVPDRGGMWLGGGGGGTYGGLRLAPGMRSARVAGRRAAGLGVSAWVHDFSALDRARLSSAPAAPPAVAAPRLTLPADNTAPSIAQLKRLREAQRQAEAGLAAQRLEAARLALARGQPGVARIHLDGLGIAAGRSQEAQQLRRELAAATRTGPAGASSKPATPRAPIGRPR